MGSDRTHQSLLGVEGCGLYGSTYAYANQQRRTCIESICGHSVEDKLCNTFIAFTGHQNSCVAGKRASAACHICVDLTLVGVRNDVPPDSRCALADIFARVVLVKSLHGIVAKRSINCSLHNGFLEKDFQIIDVRELCAAFYPELQDTCILAGRAVQFYSQFLIAEHGLIDDLCHRGSLLLTELLELGDDVVGELDAGESYKLRHNVLEFLYLCFV